MPPLRDNAVFFYESNDALTTGHLTASVRPCQQIIIVNASLDPLGNISALCRVPRLAALRARVKL
jgi:hypothetical protein